MAPSSRTSTTATATSSRTKTTATTARRRRRRQPRRTNFKKQQHHHHKKSRKQEIPTVLPSSCTSISSQDSSNSKEGEIDVSEVIDMSNSACSTPKGQKFKIPEISTCPPAPKKPRVLSNCSLRRSPLSFFAPPDLELFFFMALRDVSV